jgi:hypothetical protein
MAAATCMHLPLSSLQLICCVAVGCPSGAHTMAGASRPGHRGVCSAHAAMFRQAPEAHSRHSRCIIEPAQSMAADGQMPVAQQKDHDIISTGSLARPHSSRTAPMLTGLFQHARNIFLHRGILAWAMSK